jgi:Prealbumin-like fold domain
MSKGKRKTSVVAMMAVLASLLLPVMAAGPAQAAAPQGVSDKLQGCKPGTYNPVTVLCANGDYVNGNLGKSWNELDLVPFRLTLDAGNGSQVPATQTYTLAYAVDAIDGGKPGYDVLSVAVLNTALSTGGAGNCAFSVSPTAAADIDGATFSPGIGGTDTTRYRFITVTQAKNTKCVFDLYARLALGSSQYPGASLHANMLNENLGTSGVGADDTSIPVNQISPQELEKSMTGSQDSDHQWTVDKEANPASLSFGNVCDPNQDTTLETTVTVTWDKLPADPSGVINIHTLVEATNPAARIITVKVTDELRSGTTVLQTHDNGVNGIDVPANTTDFNVLEYTTTIPAGTTDINDVATATYIDKLTGVPVPGQTTAVFPPFVDDDNDPNTPDVQEQLVIGQGQVTNATATITDTESITGAGLTFSVAAPSAGEFTGGYVAGTATTGPVGWTSGEVSDDGSVTFDKTVILDSSIGATSGTLDDTATLAGSNGASDSANASVTIDSTLAGSLTISKTTTVPVDGDTTFEFTVTPGGSVVSVTILDGQTSGSSDPLTGLTAGNYNVEETQANGFTPADDQQFTIGAGNCTAELDFANTAGPASATALKITDPIGFEADWEFTVTLDGNPFDTGTSDALGVVQWDGAGSDTLILADEGTYTITETTQNGFVLDPITVNDNGNGSGTTDATSCSFTVDLPADSDGVFDCSFTNTKLGSITLAKETVPSPDPTDTSFEFTRDFGSATVNLKDTESDTVNDLAAGTYSAAETVPAGWDLLTFTCSDGSSPAAIELGAGEDVICTARNTQQTGTITVVKVTDPSPDTSDTEFPFTSNFMGDFSLKNTEIETSGQLTVNGGPYSVAETPVPAGWDLLTFTCDNGDDPSAITLTANENVTCTATNRARGGIEITKTLSGAVPPAGASYTFQLRTGASAGVPGDIEETLILNSGNNFQGSFTNLVPGDYQVCETEIPAGGHSTISDLPGAFAPNPPPEDNSTQCAPITVGAGETVELTIDNTPPPGGDQRTIGYWKNHASCKTSGGNQAPHLDQVLATFPIAVGQTLPGFFVGDLYVDTCVEARQLLDKRPVSGSNKKTASDPAFNLAAQYVAAKLNVQAGAGVCPAATLAINQAQTLLDTVNFNGVTSPTMTAAQKAQANSLAGTLDRYNNGDLCP